MYFNNSSDNLKNNSKIINFKIHRKLIHRFIIHNIYIPITNTHN